MYAREDLPEYVMVPARKMTAARMKQDFTYRIAQKLTEELLTSGYISELEFDKISALNREKFSPFMPEILA